MKSPLDLIREIVTDGSLTAQQKSFLTACVIHMENKTGEIRTSLNKLSDESGIARRSGTKFITAEESPETVRYFSSIEHVTQRKLELFLDVADRPIANRPIATETSDLANRPNRPSKSSHPSASSASSSAKPPKKNSSAKRKRRVVKKDGDSSEQRISRASEEQRLKEFEEYQKEKGFK